MIDAILFFLTAFALGLPAMIGNYTMHWHCKRCDRRWKTVFQRTVRRTEFHELEVCEECAIKPVLFEDKPKKETTE